MRFSIVISILWFALVACSSGLRQTRTSLPSTHSGERTVVLFLVDGLSVKTLQTAFRQSRLPHLRRFFLREKSAFAVGRAAFPSLTNPNIASILTASKIGEQPVTANQMLFPNGKVVNFELAKFHPLLRATVDPISVIGDLENAGKETASFSY